MSPPTRFRTRLAVAVLVALALAGVYGGPVGAQEDRSLPEHELEYQAALRAYDAALAAREVVQNRFNREMREYQAAKGDPDRRGQAFDEFYGAELELRRMDRRVESSLERLEEAGNRFLTALDAYRDRLATRAEALPPEATAEAQELGVLLLDLTNQIAEVDAEVADARAPVAPRAPDAIAIEPDDTEQDLRVKAQLLEERGAQYDSTLVEVDLRLQQLRERQRTDRRVREFVAGLDRFDDRQLPVVPRRSESGRDAEVGAEGEASDSTALDLRGTTVEARIQNLRSLRERLMQYRDSLKEQVRFLRQRIGSEGLDVRFA